MPSERKLLKLLTKALISKNRKRKRHRRTHRSPTRSRSRSRQSSPLLSSNTSEIEDFDQNVENQENTDPGPTAPIIEINDSDITETAPNPYKEAIGMDYEEPMQYIGKIHMDIKVKIDHVLTSGLSKEEREAIATKHTVPNNCTLLDAPQLNPEVQAVINDSSKLRDQGIEISQRQVGLAAAIIAKAMTNLIQNQEGDKHKLMSDLADAVKILSDVHFHQTKTRIKLISPLLDKNFNQVIAKTKRDAFLYGENLADLLKNVKQLQQAAAQIKKPPPVTTSNRPAMNNIPRSTQGNRNGPPPKTMKANARGGQSKPAPGPNQRRPRTYQRHRPERTTKPRSRYQNAAPRR